MNAVVSLWWTWISLASIHFLLLLPGAWLLTKMFPAHRTFQIHRIIWQWLALSLVFPRIVPVFEFGTNPTPPNQPLTAHPMSLWFWVWLISVFCLTMWTAIAHHFQRRKIFQETKECTKKYEKLKRLAHCLGVQIPSVRWLKKGSPFTFGILQQVLVLPQNFFELGQDSQKHMLLHEVTHLRHLDHWRALFSGGLRILFFFHPGVWWLSKKLETLREMACDRKVIEQTGDPVPYFRTLLQSALDPTSIQSGHAFFKRKGQLRQRMEMLKSTSRSKKSPILVFLVLIFWTFVCMPYGPDNRNILDFQAPPIAELEGCMQKKYAVMLAIAQQKENP